MSHQLVSEEELKQFCIYCKTEVNSNQMEKWGSVWDSEKHYKDLKCTCCGRPLHIKVKFSGSGHDSWNGKKFETEEDKKTIEDRIIVVERTKIIERIYPKK